MPFSIATASVRGHTGDVQDPLWSTAALELRQGASDAAGPGASVDAASRRQRRARDPVGRLALALLRGLLEPELAAAGEPASAPSLPGLRTATRAAGGRRAGGARR